MALLDRLRRRPRWEDPDPKVRADGVREIPSEEQDRLAQIASDDPDPLVRRAAVRRLQDAAVLGRIAAADADAAVRDKAAGALVALAVAPDEPAALAAAAALTEPRHLVTVVLTGTSAAVRAAVVARIQDAHALTRIARTSTDPAVRLQAVAALADSAGLAEVAARSEHKDASLAAVERLEEADALRMVASKARNKAAARRAREKLAALAPAATAEAIPAEAEATEVAPEVADSAPEAWPDDTLPPAEDEPVEPTAESVEAGSEPIAVTEVSDVAVEEQASAPPAEEEVPAEAAEGVAAGLAAEEGSAAEPSAPDAASLAPRLRADRKERVAQAEALFTRLTALVAAKPFALREAEVALRDARLPHDDLAVLPPKLARHLREARAALFARAQEAREAEEWQRWGNASAQEELCRRLEALATETDLEKAARELRTLDSRWAEVKIAPRDEATSLRQRYQAARAPLKARLDAYFTEKAAREGENLRLKQELCARAEALAESTEWIKASEELKALQARWKEIGPAPRKAADAVWKRFRAACDRFFSRRQDDLKKRKQEWSANMARKQALCERAEQLASSSDWEPAASEVRKLQAEWKTVGPVRRDRSEAVWQRFRKACDAFFERYKNRDEAEKQARLAQREAALGELESLVAAAGTEPAPADVVDQIQRITARVKQGAPATGADEEAIATRLAAARDRAVAGWPESFRGTDLDPEAGRARREKLCARVESLLAQGEPPVSALSGQDLARRLKEALATNTMGGRGEVEAKRRAEADEVKAAQATWRRLPPLGGEEGRALEHRFRSACDRFFRERPAAPATRAR